MDKRQVRYFSNGIAKQTKDIDQIISVLNSSGCDQYLSVISGLKGYYIAPCYDEINILSTVLLFDLLIVA